MIKLPQSHKGKEKNGFWLLNPASKIESLLLTLFFLLLPTQLGKHFWPNFSHVTGIRIDYLSPTFYITDLLLGLLVFTSIINLRHAGMSRIGLSRLWMRVRHTSMLWVGFIIFFFLVNILFSLRPLLSLYGLLKVLEYSFFCIYLARTIKTKNQLSHIAFLFAVSSLFESCLAIMQYLQQGSLNGIFYWFGERTFTGATPGIANVSLAGDLILRPYGTFSHPNVLAGYLLISLLFIWFILRPVASKWLQAFAAVCLVVGSIALLLTFSRSIIALWIILVGSLAVRLVFTKLQTIYEKLIATSLLLLVLGGLLLLPISHEIFTRFTQTSFTEESFTERSALLTAAVTLFKQHPVIGVGLDNFLPSLVPLQHPQPLGLYLQPVHNIFFLLAAETGFVGVFIFLELLFASVQNIWKMWRTLRYFLLLSLSVILLTGLTDHYWLTLQQGQLLFATILGLGWTRIKTN